jgi:hypothetical protein
LSSHRGGVLMETMEERLGEVAARFRVALIALSRECPPLGFGF